MPERETGPDLLRCLALLGVVTFHSFLYNGYYGEPQKGLAMWLSGSARWLSVSCVGLFLMLTGYLKWQKTDIRSCYRGLLPVLLGYALAAVITIPIRHFCFADVRTFWEWVSAFFSFHALYYGWYVEMYVGLLLLIPFLNRLLEKLQLKLLLTLAAVLLILTALPGILPVLPDYWRSCYPVTYYILGAIIGKTQPKARPWWCIAGALGIALALGAATVLSTDGTLSEAASWEFADLWIVGICLCLFLGLYRVRFHGKWLCFFSKGCYGGYLLSHLLDAWVYQLLPAWRTPEKYGLLFLTVTVPVFLVSVAAGRLLQWIADKGVRPWLY